MHPRCAGHRRRLGRRARGWVTIVAAAATIVACRSEPPAPLVVSVRLVEHLDEAGRAAVGRECAPFDERRPALGCTPWALRFSGLVGAPAKAVRPYVTNEGERWRPLLVKADWWAPGRLPLPLGGPWIEPPAMIIRPDLGRLAPPDAPPGTNIRLFVRTPPPATFETTPVAIPPGAVLTVGLAVEPGNPTDGLEGVEFTATADDGEPHELLRATLPAPSDATTAWDDRRIPLDRVAGRATRFRFTTRIIPRPGANPSRVTAIPLWGAPEIVVPGPRDGPPNVILVSLDTLRGDYVGTIGGGKTLTPRIDALAAEGVVHEHTFTTYPSTTAAHVSMLSGLYPHRVGTVFLSPALPDSVRMLAQYLGDAGWATGAVTEDVMLAASVGFPRGFSSYRENLELASFGVPSHKVERTMGAAIAWLERHVTERVFLFVHTYAVHFPYSAPPEYYAATQEAAGDRTGFDRAYSACVRYADSEVGRLADEIRRLGIASRTILIVTADHGEEFGEHGGTSHSHSVYDELLHVPLVLWGPGRLPAGRRVRTPTSLVDLVPTVLELAGLPPPAVCDGESQVARIRGGPEDMERTVFAEVGVGPRNPYHRVACHTGATKWIRSDSTPPSLVAFDLRTDAGEHRPLEDAALVERGRAAIAWYETLGQGGASAPAKPEPVDPAMQERLRSLGYAD